MSKRIGPLFFIVLFCVAFAMSAPIFYVSLSGDWQAGELEPFELVARLVGYVLALSINALSAICAYRQLRRGALGQTVRPTLWIALATVLFLCLHDVLLWLAYGNQLEGTFTMLAFFLMDAALAALYPLAMYRYARRPKAPTRALWLAIALVWAVYIVGDMAGYPCAQWSDWDEALIKFAPMCSACMLAIWG